MDRKTIFDNKVILCEHKRHTARCVANTPLPSYPGVPPHPSCPGQGVPLPPKEHGNSGRIMGWRWVPCLEATWDQWKYYGMEIWCPLRCEQTDTCENSTFSILWMRVDIHPEIYIQPRLNQDAGRTLSCTKDNSLYHLSVVNMTGTNQA